MSLGMMSNVGFESKEIQILFHHTHALVHTQIHFLLLSARRAESNTCITKT